MRYKEYHHFQKCDGNPTLTALPLLPRKIWDPQAWLAESLLNGQLAKTEINLILGRMAIRPHGTIAKEHSTPANATKLRGGTSRRKGRISKNDGARTLGQHGV